MVRLRLEQISPALGVFEDNLRLHCGLLEQACQDSVQCVVFPELSLTGYLVKDLVPEVAQTCEGLMEHFRQVTEGIRNLTAIAGFVEETPGHRFHNSAAVLRWDEAGVLHLVHVHRKVYLPTYGLFDEGRYFSPGRTVRAFDLPPFGRCGILICEDAWHLSTPLLLALDGPALEGAGVLFVLSNSPARGVGAKAGTSPESYQVWDHLLGAYSSLLEVMVVYVGRGGVEDGLTFSGGSQVLAAGGDRLARAKHFETDRLDLDLDWPEPLRSARIGSQVSAAENVDLFQREMARILESNLTPLNPHAAT
jgi:predicted amidohydrolase